MSKKFKSTLSVLLAILMIVTSIPFAFAADGDCEHSDEDSTQFKNICSKCGEYFIDYDLKVGENSGFEITHAMFSPQYLYRFIPEKNASYIFTSNKSGENSDPYVKLFDENCKELDLDDDSAGNRNFKLTYSLDADKTYYLSFQDYRKNSGAIAYTVTIEVGCEHTSTEQTCKGYKCTKCDEYYGEKGDHKGTKQDCRGYECDTCGTIFGDKDLTKHQWNESGSGKCNLCGTSCTHNFVGDAENCSICNALRYAFSVTSGSTTKKYSDLDEALENVKDGDTLKLLKDITIEGNDTYSIDKSIVFDFNGLHIRSSACVISVSENTSVTFTDSVSNSIYCGCNLKTSSKCTLGAGFYAYIVLTDQATSDGIKLSDLLPECAVYYKNSGTIDTENETSLIAVDIKQHTSKNGFEGLCTVCGKFYGTELKLGDNEISKNYARQWHEDKYLLKFVPEKTGAYLIKGSKTTGKYYSLNSYDADLNGFNGDYSEAYDPTDQSNYDYYKYFNLDAGKTYYFSIATSSSETVDSTLTISLACEHSSTTQTCRGYLCDKCSRYYGEKGDHRLKEEQTCLGYQCKDCSNHYGEKGEHDLGTEQTCLGYKCEYCYNYYGEKDETKHTWGKWGYCSFCYTYCPNYDDHKTMDTDCSICGYSRFEVELISGTTSKKYVDFAAAATDAKDGDTIKLLKDTSPFGIDYTIEKAIIFDLNGHYFYTPGSDYVYVGANVTFIDSSEDKTGYLGWNVYVNSPCKFESGKYMSIYTRLSDAKYADFLAPCAKYYDDNGNEVDLDSGWIYDVTVKQTHTIETDAAVAPTCTQAGKTAGKHCTKCDYKVEQTTVSATGHNFGSIVEAKAPTCTDGGNDAYKYCSACKKYFSADATATSTDGKADTTSFIKTKLGHDYSGEMKNDGDTHSYKCKNGCETYGNATNHAWDNGTVTTPATHLALGVKTYTCECGATKTEDIAKTAEHTHILVSTTDATHLKEGLKVYRCACGDEYTETIAKIAEHSYTHVVTAPTCEDKGYTTYTCACGDSYKADYVDALGHNYKDGICTECGGKDPNYNENQGGDTGDNTGDNATDCDCICHNDSKFVQFFYKIARWFWKLFKIHKTCDCGIAHY